MIMDMNLIVLSGMGKSRFCLVIVVPLHAERGCINPNASVWSSILNLSSFISFMKISSCKMRFQCKFILQLINFYLFIC